MAWHVPLRTICLHREAARFELSSSRHPFHDASYGSSYPTG